MNNIKKKKKNTLLKNKMKINFIKINKYFQEFNESNSITYLNSI